MITLPNAFAGISHRQGRATHSAGYEHDSADVAIVWTFVLFLIFAAGRVLYSEFQDVPFIIELPGRRFGLAALLAALALGFRFYMRWAVLEILAFSASLYYIGSIGMQYILTVCFYTGSSRPFVDHDLALLDKYVGFNWLGYLKFVDLHAWMTYPLSFAYSSISW